MSLDTVRFTRYTNFREEIEVVQNLFEKSPGEFRAASGVLFWRFKGQEIEVLLGRSCKFKEERVWVILGGKVEAKDFANAEIPGIVAAAAREVEEESSQRIKREEVLARIAEKTTRCVRNKTWPDFCSTVFTVALDVPDEELEGVANDEISELKWFSLKEVLVAQATKEGLYGETLQKVEAEAGRVLTQIEKREHRALGEMYKINPQLSSGDRVSHYSARTIALAQKNIDWNR